MDTIITKNSEKMQSFYNTITRIVNSIDAISKRHKPSFLNERFLTDKELAERLKVSRRALQDYRNQGLIPYYQFNKKNILYKESDIEKVLQDGYIKSLDY